MVLAQLLVAIRLLPVSSSVSLVLAETSTASGIDRVASGMRGGMRPRVSVGRIVRGGGVR